MVNPLIVRIRPVRSARAGQVIEYKGIVSDFSRLVEIVEADLGSVSDAVPSRGWRATPVDIRLQFGWADARQTIPLMTGRVATQIPMICQRCLQAFDGSLATGIGMLVVKKGASPDVTQYEVWELEEEELLPLDVIEESLVMAMPLAAKHDDEDQCGARHLVNVGSGSESTHPFADLRAQMEKSND